MFFETAEKEKRKRNAFLFGLIYTYALRVSEVVRIRLDHIDKEKEEILIIASKNGYPRRYDFGPTATPKLWRKYRRWLRERSKYQGSNENPYLFMTKQSGKAKHMTRDSVQLEFKRICDRAGLITKGWNALSVHSLRHSMAVHKLLAGDNITEIRKWLRHRSIESTKRYIDEMGEELRINEKRTLNRAERYF